MVPSEPYVPRYRSCDIYLHSGLLPAAHGRSCLSVPNLQRLFPHHPRCPVHRLVHLEGNHNVRQLVQVSPPPFPVLSCSASLHPLPHPCAARTATWQRTRSTSWLTPLRSSISRFPCSPCSELHVAVSAVVAGGGRCCASKPAL